MDETILFPSPNWFQVSGLAVSRDSWLIYGGPSKSLCVLEPLQQDYHAVVAVTQGYKAHVLNRAHSEKIVSVDISPEWPEKRSFLTGSADGAVKQWTLEGENKTIQIKPTHSHEIHQHEKEEIAGVSYSNEVYAITVGCYGNIVKWDLHSNVAKTYTHFLKSFKPSCMSCSRHLPLHVAIGTKQGVIFVIDLNGLGKILYKVRGQDDEIVNVSWCPQYDVAVKKTLQESEKRFSASDRLQRIRNEPEPNELGKDISNSVKTETLEASGVTMNLPDDSFDETIVEEDDTFDIYKDHEADEFGHKKYQPEDIVVKVKADDKQDDYLAECLKLKDEILKRKNEGEPSIESLVDALDKTHVDSKESTSHCEPESDKTKEITSESSAHTHKHLLATVGKYGGVRIWSKSGKLVASCAVPNNSGKNQRNKAHNWPTLLWYKPDTLLIADGKSQLLECNPLKIDCKNKLEWRIVHTLHKRGLYCIATDAPRVQTNSDGHWSAWTVSQDRNIIKYCMKSHSKTAVYATCGGFLYMVQACPYDAGKIAVSVGDGAVRVWETSTLEEDETKLSPGQVTAYWQNVQGKVLTIAWHPTRENWLAFATAESRVGLIDTSGKGERPARVFLPALSGAVYELCWGEGDELYASGGGDLVLYRAHKPDEAPQPVTVELEGQKWGLSAARWYPRALVVGSNAGAVAVLTPAAPRTVLAATFVFNKMIHTIDWHPQETSSSNDESPYKNLIAVCSLDKISNIVILEYGDKEDGSKQLATWKTLSGHRSPVLQIAWNPHRDAQLLSTSQDSTVRIWDAIEGVCTAIFGGHAQCTLGGAWSAFPHLAGKVLSGGGDCALRLWDVGDHPPQAYDENKREPVKKEKKRKDKKEAKKKDGDEEQTVQTDEHVATTLETKMKVSKKFLLPITYKQINCNKVSGARRMFQKHLEMSGVVNVSTENNEELNIDYTKIFGTINEVNEVLDIEMQRHLEANNAESWIMLSIFRGHIDAMVQYASQNDILCPYILSIAPCVSFKYWKDATQLYLAQIDRLVAKGEEEKLFENKQYGGPVYRKAATLLSVHDVKGAVAVLTEARLFKEAYILCRTRYMDSIAEQTLHQWAHDCTLAGNLLLAAVCYLALGDISKAAATLGKSNDQECLSLAADLAKHTGQTTFADHIEKKVQTKVNQAVEDTTEEALKDLPSRIELLMKDGDKVQNGEAVSEVVINSDLEVHE